MAIKSNILMAIYLSITLYMNLCVIFTHLFQNTLQLAGVKMQINVDLQLLLLVITNLM